MLYTIQWTRTSLKQLEKLDKKVAERIIDKVEEISEEPFRFVKKLQGLDLYRLRVGDYRVIISIENKKMIVFVLQVGNRSVIYK